MAKEKVKKKGQPAFNAPIQVVCSNCGAAFTVGSINKAITLNICSQCHPAYTNKQDVFIDTSNRISRFLNRQAKAQQMVKTAKAE